MHAENLQSHVLHLGFLVLPDLMGVGSVIPLASSNPEEVKTFYGCTELPTKCQIYLRKNNSPSKVDTGWFLKNPSMKELTELRKKLQDSIPDLQAVAKLFKSLAGKLPDFTRETEFIALTRPQRVRTLRWANRIYRHGQSTSKRIPIIHKRIHRSKSTAKWAKHARESYMVGALARFNINYDNFHLWQKAQRCSD